MSLVFPTNKSTCGTTVTPHDPDDASHFIHENRFGLRLDSFAQWLAISVILSSFGSVINNTGDEPKIGTFMISTSIFILAWFAPLYLWGQWKVTSKVVLGGLIFIVLLLIAGYAWLIAKIWNAV